MVLDFWSPSCEPCKRTIPAVLARRADIEKKGAVHVLVAVLQKGESVNDARAALATWGIDERFVVDEDGALLAKIGVPEVPAFAIVDSAGLLHWVAPPGVTISNILDAIP
jgi:thiol-disulfide isomerase/thioredoxin